MRRLTAFLAVAVAFTAVAVPAQAASGRPDRVANVAAAPGDSPGEIVVTWDAHPNGAKDYRVAFKPADGKFQPASDTAWNAFPLDNTVTLTGLVPGDEYRILVRARFADSTSSKWARSVSGLAAEASPDESEIAAGQSNTMTFTDEVAPPVEEFQTSTQQAVEPEYTVLTGLKFLSGHTKNIGYQGHYVERTPTEITNKGWWRLIRDGDGDPSTLLYNGKFIKGFKSSGGFLIGNSNAEASQEGSASYAYWLDSNGYIRYSNEYTGYKIDNNWDDDAYGYILQAQCCTHLAFKNPRQMRKFDGYRMERQTRDQYENPSTISWPVQPVVRISDQGTPGGWQYHSVYIPQCGTVFFRVAAVYESPLHDTELGTGETAIINGYRQGPWRYIEWRNPDCEDNAA